MYWRILSEAGLGIYVVGQIVPVRGKLVREVETFTLVR